MMSHTKLLLQDGTITFKKKSVREAVSAATADTFFNDFHYDSVYQVRVEFIQEKTGLKFMLNRVHLPFQTAERQDLLYKRIEVPAGPSRSGTETGEATMDYRLEGIIL